MTYMCLLAEDESCISFQSRDTFFGVFDVVFQRKNKKNRFWTRLYILYLHAKGAPLNMKNAEVINVFR